MNKPKKQIMNQDQSKKERIIEEIKQLFDAVPESYSPEEEELILIDERRKLEEEMSLSFKAYVENYDELKAYGLDEKLMIQLEWFIIFYLENRREEFLGSAFYQKFKNHEVVQRAEMEYERKINLVE